MRPAAAAHQGRSPRNFLASSADARLIARGLVDGNMDWSQFAAALAEVGVQLRAVPGGPASTFEVVALEHCRN